MQGSSLGVAMLAGLLAIPLAALTADDYSGCGATVTLRTRPADPANYQQVVDTALPGDLIQLAAGAYSGGLILSSLNGAEDSCIVIEGPETPPFAVFEGLNCCNVISLSNSSYLVIRNLEVDGLNREGDGVKAEGTADWVHHVTLENLYIHDLDSDQGIVGINTKCPAWNWVIRRNVIEQVGTGVYLGDSTGEDEFSHGLIEYNLFHETLGYNLQIKHQNGRATTDGAPAEGTTVLRHNVFSKASNSTLTGAIRPNLLIGHRPLAGPGSDDDTLIYGNFFYQNETVVEALFQGEGHIILYDNLLVNDFGPAIAIQPHNDVPKRVRIFQNTVVSSGTGISVSGGHMGFQQRVVGNASFADSPLSGGVQVDNIADSYAQAGTYLVNPDGQITGGSDRLDLFPQAGQLTGTSIDLSGLSTFVDWNRDFNGAHRTGSFRGGYGGEGANPGWLLALERKLDQVVFEDGFETGNLSAWSATVP